MEELKFGDKIEIIDGFYKGKVGTLIGNQEAYTPFKAAIYYRDLFNNICRIVIELQKSQFRKL